MISLLVERFRAREAAGERHARPRIFLSNPDPYLALLIQLDLPEAEVIEARRPLDPEELAEVGPHLLLVDLGTRGAGALIAARGGAKVIGIVEGVHSHRGDIPEGLDGLLVRPFVPSEMYQTIREALGLSERPAPDRKAALVRVRSFLAPARVGAVAAGAVFEVATQGVSPLGGLALAAAFAYTAIRLVKRGTGTAGALADLVFAAGLIATTGGQSSNYMLFGLVAAIGAGLALGGRGALYAGIIGLAAAPEIYGSWLAGSAQPGQMLAWISLFPLTALTAGLAERIWGAATRERSGLLAEANQVLSSLYRLARTMPGGLEIGGVAASSLGEVREALKAPAGLILIAEAGILSVAASFGLPRAVGLLEVRAPRTGLLDRGVQVIAAADLPPAFAGIAEEHPCWLSAPLVHQGSAVGLLLVACDDDSRHRTSRIFLQRLAEETALGVANARLFGSLRDLSVDEERGRLARELHDGLAQALTHVRIELEFLARNGARPDEVKNESARLARVVERALSDVRSTILGLRAAISREGLAGSLRSYLRDLRSLGGPEISFASRGDQRLSPNAEAELFRIAQEAVSNAMRHARASEIFVLLDASGPQLKLTVEDDGVGLERNGNGAGVGLRAMRERAEALGAGLKVTGRPLGGTRVELVVAASESESQSNPLRRAV